MGVMDQFSSFMNRKAGERQPAQNPGGQQQQDPNNPAGQQNPNQPVGKLPAGSSTVLERAAPGTNGEGQELPGKQTTPLDNFSGLWNNDPTGADPGKKQPYISLDRKALKERAKSLDFSKTLDPALTAKALGGDANAFHQIINQAVQGAFVLAMDGSASLAEGGFNSAESRFFERIPGELKKHTAFDSSVTTNPKLNHPAVKPMVALVQSQLQAKFPDASTLEIQQMANEYFTEFLGAVGTSEGEGVGDNGGPTGSSSQKPKETDWMKQMGLED